MLAAVKRCIESHDIKGLRYIFVDCLDVDPTFEKYKEDYQRCQKVEGLFEPYREMSPFIQDESRWDMSYWDQLKDDLTDNFSSKRFEHMIRVAKVVYADKIARLLQERRADQEHAAVRPERMTAQSLPEGVQAGAAPSPAALQSGRRLSPAELQEKELEEKRRILQKEYEADSKRIEEDRLQREAWDRTEHKRRRSERPGNSQSKKRMGVVVAAAVLAAIILTVIALCYHNPRQTEQKRQESQASLENQYRQANAKRVLDISEYIAVNM